MNYKTTYTEDYFNGKNSFFYSLGYGRFQKYYFKSLVKPILPYFKKFKKAQILDIGCAYGYVLNLLPKNSNMFGLDISEHAINTAKKNFKDITFKVGNVEEKIPFPANSFDIIILNDVIEHLENPQKALENIKKILKKDGILYITTPNLNLLRKKLFGFADKMEHHISLFSHKNLCELLINNKFAIQKNYTYSSFTYFFFLKLHKKLGFESAFICENT